MKNKIFILSLIALQFIFALISCAKAQATAPEIVDKDITIKDKAGTYIGTYKHSGKTEYISISIDKNGTVIIGYVIYSSIDINSTNKIEKVVNGDYAYIIDFQKLTATSLYGADKNYVYKLEKQEPLV